MAIRVLKCPNCGSTSISGSTIFCWCNNCLWAGSSKELVVEFEGGEA